MTDELLAAIPGLGPPVLPPDVPPPVVVTPSPTPGAAEPGITTTEFWGKNAVQFLTVIFTLLAGFGHPLSAEQQATVLTQGAAVIAGLEAIYGAARSVRKRGTPG